MTTISNTYYEETPNRIVPKTKVMNTTKINAQYRDIKYYSMTFQSPLNSSPLTSTKVLVINSSFSIIPSMMNVPATALYIQMHAVENINSKK